MSKEKKTKKKFYKRIWFCIVAIILIIGIYGAATGSNKKQNSSSNQTTSSSKKGLTKQEYEKIEIGQSKDDVIKNLGKPSLSSKTNVNGIEGETLSWSKISSTFNVGDVTVTITDGKVEGKAYTNPSLNKIKPLDKSKVDSIQTGASYKEVIDKLGQPTTESYSSIGGQNSNMVMYVTSKNGDATSFMFTNDSLSVKNETHLN